VKLPRLTKVLVGGLTVSATALIFNLMTSGHKTHIHTVRAQSSIIDGAQHPEEIPDEFAYRAVLTSLIQDSAAPTAQQRVAALTLKSIGLGVEDEQSLSAIVSGYNSAVAESSRRNAALSNPTNLEALHSQRVAALFYLGAKYQPGTPAPV